MAKSSALAVHEEHVPAIADDLLDFLLENSGEGVSTSAEDNIVPIVYLLQANSPATKKSQPTYVEGAVAGDILKRNSTHNPLVKGEEGMIVQPCYFNKVWVEWRPNRGGLAGVHVDRPADAKEVEIMNDGKPKRVWQRDNGNQLVETRQHVVLIDGQEPYVIPLSSTGHTVSRNWMQTMGQQFVPGTNKIAASYAKYYKITTTERTKGTDSWFVYKVEDLGDKGWIKDKAQLLKGKALFDAFNKGEKKATVVEEDLSDTSVSDDAPF